MKRILMMALASVAISASAQTRDVYNYIPGIADRPPEGVSGQGVVYTHRTTGVVISVGSVITRAIPVGNTCQQHYSPQAGYQQQQQPGLLETGVRAAIGAAIGNQIGGGRGREIATATGAAIGAASGQQQPQQAYGYGNQSCQTIFEQRVVGYSFTAQYQHIQMQGVSARPIQVGENVEIIIRSVFYPGS